MSTQTVRHPNHAARVVRREVKQQPPAAPRRAAHLEPSLSRDARMQEVEDRLLARVIETHPHRDEALDRLMYDLLGVDADSGGRTLMVRPCVSSVARLRRVEALLVAATVDNHPNRERALDRLIDDLFPSDDQTWDNDWDGMG